MSYVDGFRKQLAEGQNTSLLIGAGLVLLLAAPLFLGGFQTTLLTETLIFAIFATAFNLLYGYTGLLSFGHAMFVAASGYTVAKVIQVVAPALGFPELFGGASVLATFVLAVILGVVIATLLAVGVGYLSVQLTEIYFAMITLSFSMAIYAVVNQDTIGTLLQQAGYGNGVFTNGSDGITFILGDVNLFGFEFALVNIRDPAAFYVITVFVFAVSMYLLYRIVESPFGMACRAIRENPGRAEALGINVTKHSWATFIISGAFSGLAGALLIPLLTGVRPDYAYWTFSAEPVIMTVIGGPYAFLGPLVGAFSYEYLRWFISQFPLLEEYWQFTFGVLLLIVVLFFENGVYGGMRWVRERVRERRS
ncbi:branched-chain amino acid ABC transporter permease [Natronomonas sp. EA1]|uniref:branched-chain amino acid ABC transporter permease n=1 Tax=Natronomonas sp. EA1 TaxID=3421655 RepID=UPI003EB962AC